MEGTTTGRNCQYHKAIGVDVEVVGLTVQSVGVESRDIALIYIHVETMLCKYRSNRRCNTEYQGRRSYNLSTIFVATTSPDLGRGCDGLDRLYAAAASVTFLNKWRRAAW